MSINGVKRSKTKWDSLSSIGITGHPGGILATKTLAVMCSMEGYHTVLVIGCGAGLSACYLAVEYDVKVIALDFSYGMVVQTRNRAARLGVKDRVFVLQADAHSLPFSRDVFECLFVESVSLLLDRAVAFREYARVLIQGGCLADNEPTWKAQPSAELKTIIAETISNPDHAVYALEIEEWRGLFIQAGFRDIKQDLIPYSPLGVLLDYVQADRFFVLVAFFRALCNRHLIFSSFSIKRWRYRAGISLLVGGLTVGFK